MRFVCTYRYCDEHGRLLLEVVRWKEPKSFSQRRPDGHGGWKRDSNGKLTMAGCRMVPYHLDLLAAAARELREDGVVPQAIIVEGEKDGDRLVRAGFLASYNAGGAGKWDPGFARFFEGFECCLIPDNDRPGRDHMRTVARSLLPVAREVKLIDLGMTEPGADFSDWADLGHTRADLKRLIMAAPVLTLADLPVPSVMPKRQPVRLPDRLSPYARGALERAVKAIGHAPDGQQQRTLNREVFGIAQLVASGQLPAGEALVTLLNAGADMVSFDARRPWRPAELDRLVRRSFEAGLRARRGIPQQRGTRHGRQ